MDVVTLGNKIDKINIKLKQLVTSNKITEVDRENLFPVLVKVLLEREVLTADGE